MPHCAHRKAVFFSWQKKAAILHCMISVHECSREISAFKSDITVTFKETGLRCKTGQLLMLHHYKKKHKTPNRPLECFNWSEQWHVRFRQQNVPLNTRHSNYWLAAWWHYWKSSCVATLMHFPETEREKRRCRWWQQLWKWLQISRGLWILSLLDCINYPACTISTTSTVLG